MSGVGPGFAVDVDVLLEHPHILVPHRQAVMLGAFTRWFNDWALLVVDSMHPFDPRCAKHSNGMPPNLLAHYFYLWEPAVVRQAIETAWISASASLPGDRA
jgi:hypothetical protein